MHRRIAQLIWTFLVASVVAVQGQEFKVLGRTVQVHGFVSQGGVYTTGNNWLTMNTNDSSAAMTDMGLNVSSQLTDRLRIGAQVYDRNLGQLGQYHPSLDWAFLDYRARSWFGVRGGKVKTVLGLYNDTQDLDFLHPFALLPQSVYPTDVRDTTIAHTGGDVYGEVSLPRRLGAVSYTGYAGHRSDSIYSGYIYLMTTWQANLGSLTGLQYGVDLRWKTPLTGLLIGASRLNEDLSGKGTYINFLDPQAGWVPFNSKSMIDWTNQYYGQFSKGKLEVEAEYRRYVRQSTYAETSNVETDIRGWYIGGAYRPMKRVQAGSYYSRYTSTSVIQGPLAALFPNQTDTSLPQNHIYDRVISGRVDLNRFWNVKVEGHFMDGYGVGAYPDGFYSQTNPNGFKNNTNALVAKTGFTF